MKYILDTNIYLTAFRSREKRRRFRETFLPLLPVTYVCSVVAYELYVNATDQHTRELLQDFISPMQRVKRVVFPDFSDWLDAARITNRISEMEPAWRSKLRHLSNDILIAICSRKIGATLVTFNRSDFELIRRHKDFQLRTMKESNF